MLLWARWQNKRPGGTGRREKRGLKKRRDNDWNWKERWDERWRSVVQRWWSVVSCFPWQKKEVKRVWHRKKDEKKRWIWIKRYVWADRVVYVHTAVRTRCSARRHWGFTRTFSRVHAVVRAHTDSCVFCTSPSNVVLRQSALNVNAISLQITLHSFSRYFCLQWLKSEWVKCRLIVARRMERTNDGFHRCYLWGNLNRATLTQDLLSGIVSQHSGTFLPLVVAQSKCVFIVKQPPLLLKWLVQKCSQMT